MLLLLSKQFSGPYLCPPLVSLKLPSSVSRQPSEGPSNSKGLKGTLVHPSQANLLYPFIAMGTPVLSVSLAFTSRVVYNSSTQISDCHQCPKLSLCPRNSYHITPSLLNPLPGQSCPTSRGSIPPFHSSRSFCKNSSWTIAPTAVRVPPHLQSLTPVVTAALLYHRPAPSCWPSFLYVIAWKACLWCHHQFLQPCLTQPPETISPFSEFL